MDDDDAQCVMMVMMRMATITQLLMILATAQMQAIELLSDELDTTKTPQEVARLLLTLAATAQCRASAGAQHRVATPPAAGLRWPMRLRGGARAQ